VAEPATLVAESAGERLDVFVARRLPGLTRSRARRLIDEGLVTVDGRLPAKAGQPLEPGQRVDVTLPAPERATLAPEAVPLRILYEDEDLLVIDKPPGLDVHPSPRHAAHTLVNAVLAHCPELSRAGGEGRPGIVHRLDKDTSGLIIVAKNDEAHVSLARQLSDRKIEKTYLALVEGRPRRPEGVIDAPLGRHPRDRKKIAVVERGRAARDRRPFPPGSPAGDRPYAPDPRPPRRDRPPRRRRRRLRTAARPALAPAPVPARPAPRLPPPPHRRPPRARGPAAGGPAPRAARAGRRAVRPRLPNACHPEARGVEARWGGERSVILRGEG
jgi:23S rRNA-/tRNA-specific pseudouridylate synthase